MLFRHPTTRCQAGVILNTLIYQHQIWCYRDEGHAESHRGTFIEQGRRLAMIWCDRTIASCTCGTELE